MLTSEQLKQAIHRKGTTKTDAALLCVAAGQGKPVPTARVKKLAHDAGLKGADKVNFSSHLSSAEDKVFKTPDGWELTAEGRNHVAGLVGQALAVSPAATQAHELRALLSSIRNEDARAFVNEAIVCAEQSLLRAAVVLSWVGAVALLHDAAAAGYLAPINAAALTRDPKWRAAHTAGDLNRMKESVFLDLAQAVSMLDPNVKQQLDDCLKLRNACGHPSALKLGAIKVAAHLETLTLNVFAVYS